MATNRTPIRHLRRGRLTHEQDMVLQYGADARWADAFRDEDEHRDAWMPQSRPPSRLVPARA